MDIISDNAEVLGVVQSEIDRAGLSDKANVRRHPWAPPGMIIAALDSEQEFCPPPRPWRPVPPPVDMAAILRLLAN